MIDFDAKEKDKDICMGALLHAADVSNPFKPWDICKVWTKKVLDEFWNQVSKQAKIFIKKHELFIQGRHRTRKSHAYLLPVRSIHDKH